MFRRRLTAEREKDFPIFTDLRAEGITDYLAITNRFAAEGIVGDMDCVYSSWATDAPGGFREADVSDLARLMPLLALTLKAASLAASPAPSSRLTSGAMPDGACLPAASPAASPIKS